MVSNNGNSQYSKIHTNILVAFWTIRSYTVTIQNEAIKFPVIFIIIILIHSIVYGHKTRWFQVPYKDSIYIHSNSIIQGRDTTKYEYFKIQLQISII